MRIQSFITQALAVLFLCLACGKTPQPAPEPKHLILAENGIAEYTVFCLDSDLKSVSAFNSLIESYAGVKLPVKFYGTEPEGKEILFGRLKRSESVDLYRDMPEGYKVKVYGSRLVVGWIDEKGLQKALYAFEKDILGNAEYCSEGRVTVPAGYEASYEIKLPDNPEPPQPQTKTIAELISEGTDFSLNATFLGDVPAIDDCYVAQGAASDGTYAYFVLRNKTDDGAVIVKCTLSPLVITAISEKFNGGHCNDLTYNDKTGKIILAHGQSQGKILTPIDAKTLAIEADINIPEGSGAITYNRSRDSYAISQGGTTLHFMDSNFNKLQSFSRTDKTGYTAQGMGSDDSYIYFPMSKTGVDNVLVAYDWKGKEVKTMHIPVTLESESMFVVDGRYYVCFYASGIKKGAELWLIEPVL